MLERQYKTKIESALEYAGKGWPVLPLHSIHNGVCTCKKKSECSSPGKHPRIVNGVNNATTNRSIINRWWSKWPDANIGIATGEMSGLVVLDVDPAHGGKDSLDELVSKYGGINTLTQRTGGGGWHHLFMYPANQGPIKNSVGSLGKGLDIRGDSGYIVACPSNHISGGAYVLDDNESPARIPNWLLERLIKPVVNDKVVTVERERMVPEGNRNDYLTSYGGKLINEGLKGQKLKIALLEENRRKCNPPIEDAEVCNIANSIGRYSGSKKPFLFKWREALISSEGPKSSTTRHVLLTLATHMTVDGGSCYPTIAQLSDEARLSKRVVGQRLKEACNDGWIDIYEYQGEGQAWKNHGYIARLPTKLVTESNHVEG